MTTAALTLKFLAEGATEGAVAAILKDPAVQAFDAIYKWLFRSARKSEALRGVWSGPVTQTSGATRGKYRLILRFERRRGSALLVGRGLLWPDSEGNKPTLKNLDFLTFAATLQGDYLRIDFRNADEDKVQFGAIIAEVSGGRETLSGYFTAIAIDDKRPVSGSVTLAKQETMLDIKLS